MPCHDHYNSQRFFEGAFNAGLPRLTLKVGPKVDAGKLGQVVIKGLKGQREINNLDRVTYHVILEGRDHAFLLLTHSDMLDMLGCGLAPAPASQSFKALGN